MNINFFGQVFDATGYSSHCRQLVNHLYKINPNIYLECPRPPGWEVQATDNELKMITHPPYKNAFNIIVMLPHTWRLVTNSLTGKFACYCIWEGDRIPISWIEYFLDEKINYILVPSEHVRQSILETINDLFINEKYKEYNFDEQISMTNLDLKIKIIQHGVDLSIFYPIERKENEKFCFLTNGGWSKGINDRKGIQFLLQAFCQEFRKEEPVKLVIKINPVYNTPDWNLQEELEKLNLQKEHAELQITTSLVQFKSLNEFYAQGDCFVAPNMGESFGLPIAEAMACGLPVVTTNFGGQVDFVNETNGWLIDYDLIDSPEKPLYEGVKWGKPRIEHLKKLLRYAFEHKEECIEKGKKARETIEKGFTWEICAKKILEIFE